MIENKEKLIELCKLLVELKVDKIQLNRYGGEYSYLSLTEPPENIQRWQTSKRQLDNDWWYWTY